MINLGTNSGKGYDLRYRRTKLDYILLAFAFLPVLVEWAFILYRGRAADGGLPTDDVTEGAVALLVFLALGSSMFVSVKYFNFPFRITEANLARQYVLAIRLCQILNIVAGCMCLGGYLGKSVPWAVYLYIGAFVLMILSVIVYMIQAFRLR